MKLVSRCTYIPRARGGQQRVTRNYVTVTAVASLPATAVDGNCNGESKCKSNEYISRYKLFAKSESHFQQI